MSLIKIPLPKKKKKKTFSDQSCKLLLQFIVEYYNKRNPIVFLLWALLFLFWFYSNHWKWFCYIVEVLVKTWCTSDVKPVMPVGKSRALKSDHGSQAPTADQLCSHPSLSSPSLLTHLFILPSQHFALKFSPPPPLSPLSLFLYLSLSCTPPTKIWSQENRGSDLYCM